MVLRRFISRLGGRTGPAEPPFRPAGRVYAVGDLHGRHDLLEIALERIAAHEAAADGRGTLVLLGDYVDRGDGSAEVLAMLRALPDWFAGEVRCLAGNHERMMLDFLEAPERRGPLWLRNGGQQTLASFGLRPPDPGDAAGLRAGARALRAAMPGDLEAWLRDLPLSWLSGNVIFAHAGLDPALPLEAQDDATLLWGHPDFARRARRDGRWVVHGHTIVPEATADGGRVALDTGAWAKGRLSVGLLEPGSARFMTVTAEGTA